MIRVDGVRLNRRDRELVHRYLLAQDPVVITSYYQLIKRFRSCNMKVGLFEVMII